MQYIIENEFIKVTLNSFGAEIISLKKNGNELLWQNETGAWARHAPILFPICGNCQLWLDGVQYPLPKHGFARDYEFESINEQKDKIEFMLKSNKETLKIYPFLFEMFIKYTVTGNELHIDLSVKNTDNKTIYFYCGGHEAHYLPKTLDNYQLIFEKEEIFSSLNDTKGILNGETTLLGSGKVLDIPAKRLAGQASIILGNLNSDKVTLKEINGDDILTEEFNGFRNMLLWSPDGNRALCIEPWINLPDSFDNQSTDFSKKENVVKVDIGVSKTISRVIKYY